jgi:hypothetical protein
MVRASLPALLVICALLCAPCAARAQAEPPIPMQHAPRAASADDNARHPPLAWSDLSPSQQRMLEPLHKQWDQLKPGRQHHLARGAQHWSTLPPGQQQQIRERLTRWARMTPQQRLQLREKMRAFHEMTPEERAKVSAAFRKFQSLPPAERRALRERWRRMPPKQRMHWAERHGDQPIPMQPPASREH